MAVGHYENFPVASLLLPRPLRRPVAAIYRFARTADDFADEGERDDGTRLALLDGYRARLDAIARDEPLDDPLFRELAQIIREHGLDLQLFRDLLSAFSQDVTTKRYRTFADVLDYSRRSANPVGRLLLGLFRADTAENVRRSDAICTALQLVNFWQDVALDWTKGRVYLPGDELARFGVTEAQIARGDASGRWADLMAFQVARTRDMMREGAPLARAVGGRIGLELALVVAGGTRILDKIAAAGGDVFRHRPVLRAWDWPGLFVRALAA
jgi:squalene synthase HpnC